MQINCLVTLCRFMFINNFKTTLNVFFTEWFQIKRELTILFEEITLQQLNKCLQKFYLLARKCHSCLVNCVPNLLSLAAKNELKIIIFCQISSVLAYTKTILFTSVSVASGGGYLPGHFLAL